MCFGKKAAHIARDKIIEEELLGTRASQIEDPLIANLPHNLILRVQFRKERALYWRQCETGSASWDHH